MASRMPPCRAIFLAVYVGCAFAAEKTEISAATNGPYPASWGQPPVSKDSFFVPLPGGYGHGTFKQLAWISEHMARDRDLGKAQYPPAWGEPPAMQTMDLRELPFSYGMGSGTLAHWISKQALEHNSETVEEYDRFRTNTAKLQESTTYPSSWGAPPDTRDDKEDFVPLPGGYGYGSAHLGRWILHHMQADQAKGSVQYPPAWGQPPLMQTMDFRPLPYGYGSGSSTMAKWIAEKAAEHSFESVEVYEHWWARKSDPEDDVGVYPSHWGMPPASDANANKDVPLPGGYGYGDIALAKWIFHHMDLDKATGQVQYPPLWGKQPLMQTRDLVPLPYGYGSGSGTLAKWIVRQGMMHHAARPDEYEKTWTVQSPVHV